jgi:hypothetical protein
MNWAQLPNKESYASTAVVPHAVAVRALRRAADQEPTDRRARRVGQRTAHAEAADTATGSGAGSDATDRVEGWRAAMDEYTATEGGSAYLGSPFDDPRSANRTAHVLECKQQFVAAMMAPMAEAGICGEAPPAPAPGPASLSALEMLRLYREPPEAVADVKAVIARQDLAEAQKMAETQRIVRASPAR